MRKIIITLALFILIIASCKKENSKVDTNNCSATTFQITIEDEYLIAVDLTEDMESNTIVLCKSNSKTKIIKLNKEGTLLWTKSIVNNKIPSEVLSLSDNSIVILLKGETQIEYLEDTPENVWIQNGIFQEQGCRPTYEIGTSTCYTINGELEIVKFNEDGEQQWSSSIYSNIASNNSLIKNSDNSFLLLSSDIYGKQPIYINDSNGIFQDTVKFPLDSNKIVLHNISYDGQIIWKSDIENISNSDWIENFYPKIDFTKLDNKILIKSMHKLISLNSNGIETSRTELYHEHCDNELKQMIGLGTNAYLVNGGYSLFGEITTQVYYTKCIDSEGSLKWQINNVIQLKDGSSDCFITCDLINLKYYDIYGEEKWSKEGANSDCMILNCNNGVSFARYENHNVVITRTDKNGYF